MGYYCTLDIDSFKSTTSPDIIESFRERIYKEGQTNQDILDLFGPVGILNDVYFEGKLYNIDGKEAWEISAETPDGDWNQKWGYHEEIALAAFISLFIVDDSIVITMRGEDGEQWGWRVRPEKVTALEIKWVEKDNPLELNRDKLFEALI